MAEQEKLPEDIAKVRHHHKQGYQYICSALEAEEKADAGLEEWKKALRDYEAGITEFQKGISLKLSGSGSEYERAQKLQEKMQSNLVHAQSRIPELKTMIGKKGAEPTTTKKADNKTTPSVRGGMKHGPTPSSSQRPLPASQRPPQPQSPITKQKKTVYVKPQPPHKRTVGGGGATSGAGASARRGPKKPTEEEEKKVSKLKNIESAHTKLILDEVVEKGAGVSFNDIGGMENAKQTLHEIVILPALRPELFTGLRAPTRGLLLFGPPGNGKTLLAKAIASEANAVFLNITAATLTSKFIGEGEKLVRAMFAVARELQPSVIFIDEIDSLLTERKENEHEAVRRLKTEFLTAFDGVISDPDERILVMGATNRPWELDDAALRRMAKRILVPLPDENTRLEILFKLMSKQSKVELSDSDYKTVVKLTSGYSGSDLTQLAKDAALMPLREYTTEQLKSIPADDIRGVGLKDFAASVKTIRPSVSPKTLNQFNDWNSKYGCV